MNGWIVSNCAWAIAACATAGNESSLQNAQRSSSSDSTSWQGGGTNDAVQGVVTASSGPVLLFAETTRVFAEASVGEQAAVDLQDACDVDRWSLRERVDGPRHRVDVPEHFVGSDVSRRISEESRGLGADQSTRSHFQPFDLRGSKALSS
jgi:hypothetical protein